MHNFSRNKTSNLSKVHETRNSLSIFLFVDCLGLSLAISSRFTMCASHSRKSQKTLKLICSSRSFKIIDVNTAKKFVTSACYDKQHVSA